MLAGTEFQTDEAGTLKPQEAKVVLTRVNCSKLDNKLTIRPIDD